jgi:hypothetical protein
MRMIKRGSVVLLLISASACGGHGSTAPTAPTLAASTFHVTGVASDDDGAPVAGANLWVYPGAPGIPMGSGVTDERGAYSFDFKSTSSSGPMGLNADSPGHEPFVGFLFPDAVSHTASMNVRLYRIKRLTAGESTVVTIVPGDTNCGFDSELTCRTVRVSVPSDGLLTMSCDPQGDDNGGPGLTIVGYNDRVTCRNCSVFSPWRLTAGTERAVDIGMWGQSMASQSCVFKTSLAPVNP